VVNLARKMRTQHKLLRCWSQQTVSMYECSRQLVQALPRLDHADENSTKKWLHQYHTTPVSLAAGLHAASLGRTGALTIQQIICGKHHATSTYHTRYPRGITRDAAWWDRNSSSSKAH
jgi:hypothetical protein